MCGIWGIISSLSLNHSQFNNYFSVSNLIKPRGPERSNVIYNNYSFLNFHRLAINGTSSTKDQPYKYSTKDGSTYYILCNGEIYNCDSIASKYLSNEFPNGFIKGTHSDVEVIYPLFKYFDYKFDKLNKELSGEFALVIIKFNSNDKPVYMWSSTDHVSVRPLFIYSDLSTRTLIFSSLLIGITSIPDLKYNEIYRLKGGELYEYDFYDNGQYVGGSTQTLYLKDIRQLNDDIGVIQENIVQKLCIAVKDRLLSDRHIGCLLSGGLDSSLTSAITAKLLKKEGKCLYTFSIGLQNSPDCKYAKIVADHIGSIHTEIIVTEEEALSVIPDVIKVIESYDITTVRASVWQYLLAKYISEKTDIKVVIAGEGSDELLGYVYCKMAPNKHEFQLETEKLINEIHLFDGIRADRCVSHFGLEPRFPFLDKDFVDYILSIPPEWKIHTNERMEKSILRQSFEKILPNLLPSSILWRRKEAFSDGVSTQTKSWFELIKDHISSLHPTSKTLTNPVSHCVPVCEESIYYRKIWQDYFNENASHIIPHFWLPNQKWFPNVSDPSARVLNCYHKDE